MGVFFSRSEMEPLLRDSQGNIRSSLRGLDMRNWYLSSWWDCWVFVQKKSEGQNGTKEKEKKSCGPFQIIKNVDALIYDINHSLGIDDIIWQTSKNAVSISRFQIDEKIIVKGKLSNLGFSYQIEQIVGSVSLASQPPGKFSKTPSSWLCVYLCKFFSHQPNLFTLITLQRTHSAFELSSVCHDRQTLSVSVP